MHPPRKQAPVITAQHHYRTSIPFTVEDALQGHTIPLGFFDDTPFIQKHLQILRRNLELPVKERKYVIWKHTDGAGGWGNRLCATAVAFLVSLLMERIFLIDHELMHLAFNPPKHGLYYPRVAWQWQPSGADLDGLSRISIPMDGQLLLGEEHYLRDLNSTYSIVEFTEGFSLYQWLDKAFNNSIYAETFNELLPSNTDEMTTQIFAYLLSNPTPQYRHNTELLLKELDIPRDRPLYVVQYRTFYDTVSQKESLKKQHFFWNCVDSLLKQEHFQAANATIFFTTDEPSLREVASERLKVYGQTVKFNNKPVQHTSHILPDISAAAMLDWYMFGWSSATVSTGTSYAQSGIKRTHSRGHHRMALFLNMEEGREICTDQYFPLPDWIAAS